MVTVVLMVRLRSLLHSVKLQTLIMYSTCWFTKYLNMYSDNWLRKYRCS